jgi:hypothetical protein
MCRRFTGPHSVLQIFLEKIIDSIGKIQKQIKDITKNDLGLWSEEKTFKKQQIPNH